MTRRPARSRGFVLVNALVLVAALAGIAALLLARAEGSRARAEARAEAAQLRSYLDGFEALALTLLAGAEPDGEARARTGYDVPLDRGRVRGRITDLQGRFNLNRLADPADEAARAAFGVLVARLGLPPDIADAVPAFLAPGGPPAEVYARATPPLAPPGGALLMVEQLRAVPGLDAARNYDRLRPHVAALPDNAPLNVNAASAEVLQSLFPGMSPAIAARLVAARAQAPFTSLDDFVGRLIAFGAAGLLEGAVADFGVTSRWFGVEMEAELAGNTRARVAVIERRPLPEGPRVAYRLDTLP